MLYTAGTVPGHKDRLVMWRRCLAGVVGQGTADKKWLRAGFGGGGGGWDLPWGISSLTEMTGLSRDILAHSLDLFNTQARKSSELCK